MSQSSRRPGETREEYARRLGFGGADDSSETDGQAGSQDQSVGEQVVQDEATESFREQGALPDREGRAPSPSDQTKPADPTEEASGDDDGSSGGVIDSVASAVGGAVNSLTGRGDESGSRQADQQAVEAQRDARSQRSPGSREQDRAALNRIRQQRARASRRQTTRRQQDSTVTADDIVASAQPGSEPLIDAEDVAGAGGDLLGTARATGRGVRQTGARVERGVSNRVGRGSPASETARDTAATALDLAFQDPQEALEATEDATGVETGLDVRERTGGINVSGPGVVADVSDGQVFESGGRGRLNRNITDSLTRGPGLFPTSGDAGGFFSETEQSLRETAEQRREFFGVGDEAASATPNVDVGGADLEEFARGAGNLPGDVASAPASLLLAADTAVEATSNAPRTTRQFGAGDTARATLEVGGRAAGATIDAIERNPERFAGNLAGATVAGFGAGRAIQRAPDTVRNIGIRARGGRIYSESDLADPPTRTEGLELPAFSEEARRDPEVAAEEFMDQARRNAIAGDDPVAFSVRGDDAVSEFGGFGRDFEAPAGRSEIPGVFQSADLSNLRLPGTEGSGISIGLPSVSTSNARALAERDIDVDIAEGQTTSEVGDFIAEEADRDRSFVRGGDVTPEQEVIAPPGSRFVDDDGVFGIRVGGRSVPFTDREVGGRIVTGRLTRRADSDRDTDADLDGGSETRDTISLDEVAESNSRAFREARESLNSEPDAPFFPVAGPSAGGSSTSGDRRTTTTPGFTSSPGGGTGETGPGGGSSGSGSGTDTGGGPGGDTPPGSSGPPGSDDPPDPASPPNVFPPGNPDESPPGGSSEPPGFSPPGSPPTTTPGTPGPPFSPPRSRPPQRPDLFETDLEPEDRLPEETERGELFSSGFVSGEELFDLETGGSDDTDDLFG